MAFKRSSPSPNRHHSRPISVSGQRAAAWVHSPLLYCTEPMDLWSLVAAYCFPMQPSRSRLGFDSHRSLGVHLLNTFFVWPKLLAAAYALGWIAFLFSKPLISRTAPIAAGVLLGLSLLSYGGTIFMVPALLFALPLLGRRFPARNVFLPLAIALVLSLPWLAYQKFHDPPGDRLIKWHLVNVQVIDNRGSWQAIREACARRADREQQARQLEGAIRCRR